jgi:hypothetical protein
MRSGKGAAEIIGSAAGVNRINLKPGTVIIFYIEPFDDPVIVCTTGGNCLPCRIVLFQYQGIAVGNEEAG